MPNCYLVNLNLNIFGKPKNNGFGVHKIEYVSPNKMADLQVPESLIDESRRWAHFQNVDQDGIAAVSIITKRLEELLQELKLFATNRGSQLFQQMATEINQDCSIKECVQCEEKATKVSFCYKCLESSCCNCGSKCDACTDVWGCKGCEVEEDWTCDDCTVSSRQLYEVKEECDSY